MEKKIFLASGATILLAAGIFLGFYSAKTFNKQQISVKDEIIRAQVQQASSILNELYNQSQAGEFSVNYAKSLGADILRGLRYGDFNEGYFWVDTEDGVNVVLYGNKEVEGKNRLEDQVNGFYYIKEIIKNGKMPGGGYTDYYYPKMGKSEPLAKRGYSIFFEPFGWVIGTGYYLEDIK